MPLRHEDITEKVLAACFEVINELGCGFVESVYHNALLYALAEAGMKAESEVPLNVRYRSHMVGVFKADIVVNETVLLELKAVKALLPEHIAQVINYLKATGLEVGLLINFGNPKLEIRRLGNTI